MTFICVISAAIKNTRMKLGITWVSQGVLQMPNIFSVPTSSSIANRMSATKRYFHAARCVRCFVVPNIVMAMNPAITLRKKTVKVVIPYTQS